MNSLTIILAFALIAAAAAHAHGGVSYAIRSDHHGHHTEVHGKDDKHGKEYVDYYHHPSYKYSYGVDDPKTKDSHSQWEHRDGDKVTGEYTLAEADGTKRIVKYSADKHGGFTAHVERVGHASHPAHSSGHGDGHHH